MKNDVIDFGGAHCVNIISHDTRLPTPPAALPYLLQNLSDDDIDYQHLADSIIRFPSIGARLISLANSAWSAPRRPILSLERACTQLGLRLVRTVSISLAVSAPFNPMRCPAFDPQRFWCSAFLVADGAAWLTEYARSVTELDPKTAHTAGLLHNLGLLWVAENLPEAASQALAAATADATMSVQQILRDLTHTDYLEVGGNLGRAWELPEVLVVGMEHHGNPGYIGAEWQTAALLRSAVAMVAALQRGTEWQPDEQSMDRLGITETDQQAVFAQLTEKLEDTRAFTQTLCLVDVPR